MLFRDKSGPSSLQALVLNRVADYAPQFFGHPQSEGHNLPDPLKARVLQCLTNRSSLTLEYLKILATGSTTSLNFSSMNNRCAVTDEWLDVFSPKNPDVNPSNMREIDFSVTSDDSDKRKAPFSRPNFEVGTGLGSGFTSAGLSRFFSVTPNLSVVKLRRCSAFVTDDVIQTLVDRTRGRLNTLLLTGCQRLTDNAVFAIADKSVNLVSVSFTGNPNFSDKAFIALSLAPCATKLQEVLLSKCVNITEVSVQSLYSKCPSLSILTFHGCPKVSMTNGHLHETLEASPSGRQSLQRDKSRLKQISWTIY